MTERGIKEGTGESNVDRDRRIKMSDAVKVWRMNGGGVRKGRPLTKK